MTSTTTVASGQALDGFDVTAVFSPVWESIRERHPELPAADFAFSHRRRNGKAIAWVYPAAARPVVTMTPYAIARGAHDAFAVVTHEAAHVLDYRRAGRRSNAEHGTGFAEAAVNLGLSVQLSVYAHRSWIPMYPYPSEKEIQSRRWWPIRRYDTEWNEDLRPVYATALNDLSELLAPWMGAMRAGSRDVLAGLR